MFSTQEPDQDLYDSLSDIKFEIVASKEKLLLNCVDDILSIMAKVNVEESIKQFRLKLFDIIQNHPELAQHQSPLETSFRVIAWLLPESERNDFRKAILALFIDSPPAYSDLLVSILKAIDPAAPDMNVPSESLEPLHQLTDNIVRRLRSKRLLPELIPPLEELLLHPANIVPMARLQNKLFGLFRSRQPLPEELIALLFLVENTLALHHLKEPFQDKIRRMSREDACQPHTKLLHDYLIYSVQVRPTLANLHAALMATQEALLIECAGDIARVMADADDHDSIQQLRKKLIVIVEKYPELAGYNQLLEIVFIKANELLPQDQRASFRERLLELSVDSRSCPYTPMLHRVLGVFNALTPDTVTLGSPIKSLIEKTITRLESTKNLPLIRMTDPLNEFLSHPESSTMAKLHLALLDLLLPPQPSAPDVPVTEEQACYQELARCFKDELFILLVGITEIFALYGLQDKFRKKIQEMRDDEIYAIHGELLHNCLIYLAETFPRNEEDPDTKEPQCSISGGPIPRERNIFLADGLDYDLDVLLMAIKAAPQIHQSHDNKSFFSPHWAKDYAGEKTKYRSPAVSQFFHPFDIERIKRAKAEKEKSPYKYPYKQSESAEAELKDLVGSPVQIPKNTLRILTVLNVLKSQPARVVGAAGASEPLPKTDWITQSILEAFAHPFSPAKLAVAAEGILLGLTQEQLAHPNFGQHITEAIKAGFSYEEIIQYIPPRGVLLLAKKLARERLSLPLTLQKHCQMQDVIYALLASPMLNLADILRLKPHQLGGIAYCELTIDQVTDARFTRSISAMISPSLKISIEAWRRRTALFTRIIPSFRSSHYHYFHYEEIIGLNDIQLAGLAEIAFSPLSLAQVNDKRFGEHTLSLLRRQLLDYPEAIKKTPEQAKKIIEHAEAKKLREEEKKNGLPSSFDLR